VIHATYLQSSSTLSQGQYRHELLEGNRVHRLCHMVIEPCFQCATLIFVLPPACHGDEHHALAPVLVSNAPRRLTLADWHLFDQSEAWREATLGTREERKAKLASSAIRQAMKREYDSGEFTKSRPNLPFEIEISTYVAAHVTRADLKGSQGRTLAQIAAAQCKHLIDAMLDLSLADDLNCQRRSNFPQNRRSKIPQFLEHRGSTGLDQERSFRGRPRRGGTLVWVGPGVRLRERMCSGSSCACSRSR
jgi:hypothetical protein